MSRLLSEFFATPWAIVPDRLPVIRAVLERWESGAKLSPEEIRAAVGDAPAVAATRRAQQGPKGIAILPILGVLAQRRAGDASEPGTATDTARRQFAEFMQRDDVGAIVLDVDSPGGSVFGMQEFAADIFAARGRKKVVACANSLAASAAYWVGSAAEEFVMTPGGQVGSIGVLTAHEDRSGELEQKGIRVELISAGKYKTEGNPFGPLTDEGRANRQAQIDEYYNAFTSAVARHRGVKPADVRNGFGQGRTVGAQEAVRLGMADRIATLDQVIGQLFSSPGAQAPRSARAEFEQKLAIALHSSDSEQPKRRLRTRADYELEVELLRFTPAELQAMGRDR